MNVTIVNYHYVRPLPDVKFPNIKAFPLKEFERRITHYKNNFTLICPNKIAEFTEIHKTTNNLMWLTFDDGLIDHYEYVLPLLTEHNISGTFFPSARPVMQSVILPVHKIQLMLARGWQIEKLTSMLVQSCIKNGFSYTNIENLIEKFDFSSRFDDLETSIFKKLLQKYLPNEIRHKVLHEIFEQVIDMNEAEFAKLFYLQREHIEEMLDNNMSIGGHGGEHLWLGNVSEQEQLQEIQESSDFLDSFSKIKTRIFSYPYGSYNQKTIEILKYHSFEIGLTTIPKNAELRENNLMKLPRYDANDRHF